MLSLHLLLLVAAATVIHAVPDVPVRFGVDTPLFQRTYNGTNSRIINGQVSELFTRPYQASIQLNIPPFGWFHFCGAVVIDVDRLVSAAHCLVAFPVDSIRIEVGSLDLSTPPLQYTQFSDVLAVDVHERYSTDVYQGFPNDIGIIYLKTPLVYNENVQPAKIAPLGQTFDGEECVISGWGKTVSGGEYSLVLREAKMRKWTYQQCYDLQAPFEIIIDENHLCVKGEADENGNVPGACNGDSGGPLLCGEKRQYLTGVTSYGFDACSTDYPIVYTRVAGFNDWINNKKHPKDRNLEGFPTLY